MWQSSVVLPSITGDYQADARNAVARYTGCSPFGMATDKHYGLKHDGPLAPLEDKQPTDMPAARTIFVMIGIVAGIALAVLAALEWGS